MEREKTVSAREFEVKGENRMRVKEKEKGNCKLVDIAETSGELQNGSGFSGKS